MRFLAKLGAWLKTPRAQDLRPQDLFQRGLDEETIKRMPRTPAELFKNGLLNAVTEAHDQGRVVFASLDPSVRVMVLPPRDRFVDKAQERTSEDVNHALRQLEQSGRTWSSVTWAALRDSRPPFSPTASEWAGDHARRFDDDMGIVFFVDLEAVALCMCQAAEQTGFVAKIDDDAMIVRVSDGRFVAHVSTSAILAEALWTARGPANVVAKRSHLLPSELRSFLTTWRALERRFVGIRFDIHNEGIVAHLPTHTRHINYRHTAVAMRATGLPPDEWFKRVELDDICEDTGEPIVLARSPRYLKAYPNTLALRSNEYVLVAAREQQGRATPVTTDDNDAPGRFGHYFDESTRQLPFFAFQGHAFVVEQGHKGGPLRAACIVGDKAATVAIHDGLVRGVLEQLMPFDDTMLVRAYSENSACFFSANADHVLINEVRRRARELEFDLLGDTSDPLLVERTIDLPDVGHGHFQLVPVPEQYFSARDQAVSRSDLGKGHSDYLRGLCFQLLDRHEDAAHHLERAVRASSADGEMNLALGRSLSALGQFDRAVVFLQRAASSLVEHAEAHNALGIALRLAGQPARANDAFAAAVKLAPDEVPFLVNFGRSLCEQQMYNEARSALERALRLNPDIIEAHAAIAVVYHRLGERDLALRHAKEAMASDGPAGETVEELLKLIDETEPPAA